MFMCVSMCAYTTKGLATQLWLKHNFLRSDYKYLAFSLERVKAKNIQSGLTARIIKKSILLPLVPGNPHRMNFMRNFGN